MRGSLKFLLLVAALLAGALIFAACGGGDDDGDNGSTEPDAEQPVDDGDDGDNVDDGGDDGDDVPADDVADELRQFAEQFGVREFKIVYELSGGGDDLGFGGQMTMYFKPPDGFRTDISSELGDIISITRDGTTYSCFSDGGEGQCLESPGTDDLGAFAFNNPDDLIESSNLPFDGGNVTRSSREIAGLDATCYSAEGEDLGEICFSDDGAMLAILDGSGEFGLEAIEVSNSVPDDAFDLPYDVVDLSDFVP